MVDELFVVLSEMEGEETLAGFTTDKGWTAAVTSREQIVNLLVGLIRPIDPTAHVVRFTRAEVVDVTP